MPWWEVWSTLCCFTALISSRSESPVCLITVDLSAWLSVLCLSPTQQIVCEISFLLMLFYFARILLSITVSSSATVLGSFPTLPWQPFWLPCQLPSSSSWCLSFYIFPTSVTIPLILCIKNSQCWTTLLRASTTDYRSWRVVRILVSCSSDASRFEYNVGNQSTNCLVNLNMMYILALVMTLSVMSDSASPIIVNENSCVTCFFFAGVFSFASKLKYPLL